jgi:hypothetical protein
MIAISEWDDRNALMCQRQPSLSYVAALNCCDLCDLALCLEMQARLRDYSLLVHL